MKIIDQGEHDVGLILTRDELLVLRAAVAKVNYDDATQYVMRMLGREYISTYKTLNQLNHLLMKHAEYSRKDPHEISTPEEH